MTSDRARELAQQLVARADLLLHETVESDESDESHEKVSSGQRLVDIVRPRGWLTHPAVAVFLNVVVVATGTEAVIAALGDRPPEPAGFGPVLLRIVVVWVLSFSPGWIFVYFLGVRIRSIWDEYVVQLYRLGLDRPENLPPPPLTSPFYESWQAAGGERRLRSPNLYRRKFDAHYGASVSGTGLDRLHRARAETLLPVFLLTALLAVCWTAVLWDVHPLDPGVRAATLWTCLAFGFLGAYTFGVNMLVGRFLQDDMRASAYMNFVLRVIVVLLLAAGAHPLLDGLRADAPTQAVVMFVIGIFPLNLLRAVPRLAFSVLRVDVPSLRPAYPLSDLEGMSIWDESRLLDVGIEDIQNLATANLVDLLLHTRIPMARLVDWIDQAQLLLHLGGSEQGLAPKFRQLGIRTATDLLAVLPADEMESRSEGAGSTKASLDALADLGVDATTVRNLVRALAREPALDAVRNWRSGGPGHPTTANASAEPRVT
jgi:hypothetical protein